SAMIIPSRPAHSAVRTIAPKFLTSVIRSRIIKKGSRPSLYALNIRLSTDAYDTGERKQITPWWFFDVIRLSFSGGTKDNGMLLFFATAISSLIRSFARPD